MKITFEYTPAKHWKVDSLKSRHLHNKNTMSHFPILHSHQQVSIPLNVTLRLATFVPL